MSDAITLEITKKLEMLPVSAKKALLGLLNSFPAEHKMKKKKNMSFEEREEWKKQLLSMPPLTKDEIKKLEKAREYVHSWKPRELF